HHAVEPRVEGVGRIVFADVFPKLDEDELRDVFRVLSVADDAIAKAVDLRRLPADELLERIGIAVADRFNELTVIRFYRLIGRDHQAKFRRHRDISTKEASKTSIHMG